MNELIEGAEDKFWPNSAGVEKRKHTHTCKHTHPANVLVATYCSVRGVKIDPGNERECLVLCKIWKTQKGVLSSEGFYSDIKPKAES